ncbi:MAG TPA: FadR family transcriptional regulator [Kiloniellaceae bacterium]|nr:FadR family transcriptional regulator [Kiloniellaceae bacterium]
MKPPASTRSADQQPRRPQARGRNRPQAVAEIIKTWIIDHGLAPGDRLPQEPQLIADLEVSKGTVREALRVLETQGLIRTRTGPGGGAFITELDADHAAALLANHSFFKEISIADIYELRIALEPQLAFDLAGTITAEQIEELRTRMKVYTEPPRSISEEREQRVAELGFHEALAGFSDNPLLGFICGFMVRLLRDLTVCKRIYEQPNPELRKRGLSYQEQLIKALIARDADEARAIMQAHMRTAQRIMLAQEAQIARAFLSIGDR